LRHLFDAARRWILQIWKVIYHALHFTFAVILAPIVLPIAWLAKNAKKRAAALEESSPLPAGIPTRREMKALQPHMASGDAAALRIWLRGAFYFHAIEDYAADPEAAAEAARDLAELANADGGYRATVKARA
jgi:hypothetical protein